MNRRLYFVVDSAAEAAALVDELERAGVDRNHIHALARDPQALQGLPTASPEQQRDRARLVEKVLWNANLTLFAAALIVFVAVLISQGATWWALVPAAVMAATFGAGLSFTHVPNTHLDEFREALTHGEVVVMADAPRNRVASIESTVHRRQPEAAVGGVGWSTDMLRV